MKRRFSADVKEIIMKSGNTGVEYAKYVEEWLAHGNEVIAEKYGNDLARFLKNALLDFRISSVEYDRAIDELKMLVVIKEENAGNG